MKTKRNLINCFISIALLSMIMIVSSCKKDNNDNNDNPDKFPTTPEQIAEAVENTNLIADVGADRIEEAISSAYYSDEVVNPNEIVEQILLIEGVESAEATSTGNGIVIKQDDGTFSNLLIVTEDDERLFIDVDTKSTMPDFKSTFIVKENPVIPNGSGKAIILVPFQQSQNTNINQISNLLESAGYSVDTYADENADLTKFRGDFLNNYDVVFIRTHGAANLKTRGGDISTLLLTGEEYTSSATELLSEDEQKAIATGGHDGKTFFAISVPWLATTTNNNFTNSWIYASACESAMVDAGSSSLSESFLNLGSVGYNGFDASINTSLATSIAEKMVARFTSGLSFNNASDEVRSDWGLLAKAWLMRVVADDSDDIYINVGLFDNNKNISDPFYLIDPEEIVGFAKVIPDAGPVDTEVIFEVTINEKFISQVASIEFDIDNTGEHFTMSKINTNTWQRDGLSAPTADSYPRIDTFTFSAFDSDGNLIGQGSATFSILEESSKKSVRIKKSNYYAQ